MFKELLDVQFDKFPRMTYSEAMRDYASDKPDLRIPLKLVDVADLMQDVEFKVFAGPAKDPERPYCCASRTRCGLTST